MLGAFPLIRLRVIIRGFNTTIRKGNLRRGPFLFVGRILSPVTRADGFISKGIEHIKQIQESVNVTIPGKGRENSTLRHSFTEEPPDGDTSNCGSGDTVTEVMGVPAHHGGVEPAFEESVRREVEIHVIESTLNIQKDTNGDFLSVKGFFDSSNHH